jgi:F-type H+-transporting ATPase subunit gamma
MANWKEIKRRIKSIKNTAKITKAMELISTVKMKKAQDLANSKKAFIMEVLKVFLRVEASLKNYPLFNEKTEGKTLGVLVTSNKWLCGWYNVNVLKALNNYKKTTGEEMDFIAVWKRAAQFVARTWNNLIADFSEGFSDNIDTSFSRSISRFLTDQFLTNWYSKVVVVYNHYVNTIKQIAISRKYVSISKEEIMTYLLDTLWEDETFLDEVRKDILIDYDMEPSEEVIAMQIIPMILDMMFFDILLEAKASEHSARMVAMKAAKDNANKFASKLTLAYNKARQAAITKEVSEIVSWVESLKD